MRYKVTYASGSEEEIELSDCENTEAACNRVFGCSQSEAEENGMKIIVADGTTAVEEKPKPRKIKAAE